MTDIIEIAWLGGLLEGEAWFGIQKKGRGYRYPIIKVSINDEDTIVRAAAILGTKVVRYKNRYIAQVYGANAVKWMLILLPFLGERRRNVIAGIIRSWKEHSSHISPKGQGRRMATCHPDRISRGFGLCGSCYAMDYRKRKLLRKVG